MELFQVRLVIKSLRLCEGNINIHNLQMRDAMRGSMKLGDANKAQQAKT